MASGGGVRDKWGEVTAALKALTTRRAAEEASAARAEAAYKGEEERAAAEVRRVTAERTSLLAEFGRGSSAGSLTPQEEASFWAALAAAEAAVAAATTRLDDIRAALYFPVKTYGYRFAAGGVYVGMRDFWVESVKCAVDIRMTPAAGCPWLTVPGEAARSADEPASLRIQLSPLSLVLHIDKLGLRGESIPAAVRAVGDVVLVLELAVEVPLAFVSPPPVPAAKRTGPHRVGAPPSVDALERFSWRVQDAFRFEVVKMEYRTSNLLALPTSLVQYLLNTLLPPRTKEGVVAAMPPELGLMMSLCADHQFICAAHLAISSLPLDVLNATLEAAMDLDGDSGGSDGGGGGRGGGGGGAAGSVSDAPTAAPALPRGVAMVEGGRKKKVGRGMVARAAAGVRNVLSRTNRGGPAAHPNVIAGQAAAALGLTAVQARTWVLAQQAASGHKATGVLRSVGDVMRFVTTHNPSSRRRRAVTDASVGGAVGAAARAAAALDAGTEDMEWAALVGAYQSLVDTFIDDACASACAAAAGSERSDDAARLVLGAQTHAVACRMSVADMFHAAEALSDKPVEVSLTVDDLLVRYHAETVVGMVKALHLRLLREKQDAVSMAGAKASTATSQHSRGASMAAAFGGGTAAAAAAAAAGSSPLPSAGAAATPAAGTPPPGGAASAAPAVADGKSKTSRFGFLGFGSGGGKKPPPAPPPPLPAAVGLATATPMPSMPAPAIPDSGPSPAAAAASLGAPPPPPPGGPAASAATPPAPPTSTPAATDTPPPELAEDKPVGSSPARPLPPPSSRPRPPPTTPTTAPGAAAAAAAAAAPASLLKQMNDVRAWAAAAGENLRVLHRNLTRLTMSLSADLTGGGRGRISSAVRQLQAELYPGLTLPVVIPTGCIPPGTLFMVLASSDEHSEALGWPAAGAPARAAPAAASSSKRPGRADAPPPSADTGRGTFSMLLAFPRTPDDAATGLDGDGDVSDAVSTAASSTAPALPLNFSAASAFGPLDIKPADVDVYATVKLHRWWTGLRVDEGALLRMVEERRRAQASGRLGGAGLPPLYALEVGIRPGIFGTSYSAAGLDPALVAKMAAARPDSGMIMLNPDPARPPALPYVLGIETPAWTRTVVELSALEAYGDVHVLSKQIGAIVRNIWSGARAEAAGGGEDGGGGDDAAMDVVAAAAADTISAMRGGSGGGGGGSGGGSVAAAGGSMAAAGGSGGGSAAGSIGGGGGTGSMAAVHRSGSVGAASVARSVGSMGGVDSGGTSPLPASPGGPADRPRSVSLASSTAETVERRRAEAAVDELAGLVTRTARKYLQNDDLRVGVNLFVSMLSVPPPPLSVDIHTLDADGSAAAHGAPVAAGVPPTPPPPHVAACCGTLPGCPSVRRQRRRLGRQAAVTMTRRDGRCRWHGRPTMP